MNSATDAPWWRGATIYQIYPLSFCDSNGDGWGDLPGVLAHLDHVASLGVDGVWLSPFFTTPLKDFGYDVADYCGVDPVFGTLADFDAVVARAHALGLKLIIDQVYSHTADAHAWFTESRADRTNSKADWYVWADPRPDGTPPNNWQSLFGGPAWEWDPRRRQYFLHNFLTSQPDLNLHNVAVQNAILDVARFWLDRGVDGFRLDVANYYMHDVALRDNPKADYLKPPNRPHQFQKRLYDSNRPENLAFIARLRGVLDSYPDRMAVGELVADDELAAQRAYTIGDDRLHTAYSFQFLYARDLKPADFVKAMGAWSDGQGWPSWSLGNHDVPRFASRLCSDNPAHTRVMLAALLALRGTIFLYQGEELGLPDGAVSYERLRDPEAIRFWPAPIGRDGARTPMPWTPQPPMAGFTSAPDAWLPMDPRHPPFSAPAQSGPDSFLAFARGLIGLRRASPALRLGAVEIIHADAALLALTRRHGDSVVAVVLNFSDQAQAFTDPALIGATALPCGLAGQLHEGVATLPGFGGVFATLARR
ncbi:MAG: alpha-glucosidase [Caulobacterales bacterium]|jgi:alpha-glucosidase